MNYKIIATGSDGNATIINDKILVDCGVPYKALKPYAKDLALVLLTHEHGDHFKAATVRSLHRARPAVRFACCPWLVQKLIDAGVSKRVIDVFTPGAGGWYNGLGSVIPTEIPHNVRNCAWSICTEDGGTALYATDCGSLEGVTAPRYDLYFVEANHSRDELEARAAEKEAAGEYAYEIKAAENHLSYEQAADWLVGMMGPQSIWIPMHQHKTKERSVPHEQERNADGG